MWHPYPGDEGEANSAHLPVAGIGVPAVAVTSVAGLNTLRGQSPLESVGLYVIVTGTVLLWQPHAGQKSWWALELQIDELKMATLVGADV